MKQKIILGLMLALSLMVGMVAADGAYFPQPGEWVRPGQQRAVIFFEDNTETMLVTSSFQGNARDLIWIVPTPTKPEVTKASEKVFMNADILTRPNYGDNFVMQDFGGIKGASEAVSGVAVIESKQVDYYDVNVLLATNSQDLVTWFNTHGYVYPDEYAYVLNAYIEKGWYFTAIKVSPSSQGATEVIQDLKEGNPTPIKMVFLTDKMVFPLKISAVDFPPHIKQASAETVGAIRVIHEQFYTKVAPNEWQGDARYAPQTMYTDQFIDTQPGGYLYDYYPYASSVPITLYVIGEEKYTADGFYTEYANKITKEQVENLGYDDAGNPYMKATQEKYFITRLQANYQKSQMDEDLFLRKANDNKKVNAGKSLGQNVLIAGFFALITLGVWIFSPLGILFIIGFVLLCVGKSRDARLAGKVLTLIAIALTSLALCTLTLIMLIGNSMTDPIALTLLGTGTIIECLIVLATILNWRRHEH